MMLFSATYEKDVMQFAECIIPNPYIIKLKREEESVESIKQYYVDCPSQESKYRAIAMIYSSVSVGQAIIFCHVSCIFLVDDFLFSGGKTNYYLVTKYYYYYLFIYFYTRNINSSWDEALDLRNEFKKSKIRTFFDIGLSKIHVLAKNFFFKNILGIKVPRKQFFLQYRQYRVKSFYFL